MAFKATLGWWWLPPLAAGLLLPMTLVTQSVAGWTPGLATLMLMLWPICIGGLSGRPRVALATALMGLLSLTFEVGFALLSKSGRLRLDPGLVTCISILLPACGLTISVHIQRWQRQLDAFHRKSHEYLRELCDPYQTAASGLLPTAPVAEAELDHSQTPEQICQSLAELDPHAPLLYVTLQEIGRRVSTDLDLETLLPTIESTARKLLRSERCTLYFWNSQTQSLIPALPQESHSKTFIPHPDLELTSWVLEARQVLTRQMVQSDPRFEGLLEAEPDFPDAMAPLTVGNELLGLMVLQGVEEESPLFLRLLYILTNISSLGIKNAQMFKRMEDLAKRDGMTGLLNRASFEEQLKQTVVQAQRTGQLLTLVMSDVDHFKHFNDTHGHPAGDEALRTVARIWQQLAPENAIIGRYGGEEFICAVPGQTLEEGLEFAEAVRHTIQEVPVSYNGRALAMTASFGVAELNGDLQDGGELIRDADVALYRSKHAGRNRVSCAAHSPRTTPSTTELEAATAH